jgi:hypothetical protein
MRRIVRPALLAACAALLVAAAAPAWSYECSTGPQGNCACKGEQDCSDMRHSTVCAGSCDCAGSGKEMQCGCAASRANPGNGGSGDNSGIRRPPNEAPPPIGAKPP